MILGFMLTPFGTDPQAWKNNAWPAALGFDALLEQVLLAETAGFDFVFLADRMGERPTDAPSSLGTPFEPTTLASALATKAKNIGFIATSATHQHEAYNLARRFASLDWISHGRSGWNVVAGSSETRDREYVEVVSDLWDSWEDDAFIYDKAAGRIFEPAKMHVLDHHGAHLSVRGPLNVNRSPQGKPVLSALHGSKIADTAEVIFLPEQTSASDAIGKAARRRSNIKLVRILSDLASASETIATDTDMDGFVIAPTNIAVFKAFIADVVPKLNVTTHAPGATLRTRLGLARPDFILTPQEIQP